MYIGNAETRELWDQLRPWMQGAKLREDAPEEVKGKLELLKRLMDEEEERQIKMMGDDLMLQTILDKLGVNSMDEFWENEKRISDEYVRKGLTVKRRNPLLKLTEEEMDFLADNGYVK